ncbi:MULTISPECIES: hypothetical protein [unclassified Lysobacter]|uniref:hypothetical protein n=1 Tax=unclassified Lysobacter TaxID=2635362 RepID=UPI001C2493AC|nr:hypothetical protein [Lysobacter sp. MMG2]MBU8977975.1 hypothetical protein [Lysobacter sp. MMG2]
MHQARRLAGTELTQTERFALLALRHRNQLFRWERELMAPQTMQRLGALGLVAFEGNEWEPTLMGSELIARLSGHDLTSIALPDLMARLRGAST